MKKKPHPLLVFAACLVMVYLTGAFMNASFNLAEWQAFVRFFVAFFGVILSGVIAFTDASK